MLPRINQTTFWILTNGLGFAHELSTISKGVKLNGERHLCFHLPDLYWALITPNVLNFIPYCRCISIAHSLQKHTITQHLQLLLFVPPPWKSWFTFKSQIRGYSFTSHSKTLPSPACWLGAIGMGRPDFTEGKHIPLFNRQGMVSSQKFTEAFRLVALVRCKWQKLVTMGKKRLKKRREKTFSYKGEFNWTEYWVMFWHFHNKITAMQLIIQFLP